jgi:hypothetical protein
MLDGRGVGRQGPLDRGLKMLVEFCNFIVNRNKIIDIEPCRGRPLALNIGCLRSSEMTTFLTVFTIFQLDSFALDGKDKPRLIWTSRHPGYYHPHRLRFCDRIISLPRT